MDASGGIERDVLVVVESMFGNTRAVAEEIAAGVREAGQHARVVAVADAAGVPVEELDRAGLLVLGGPTHAFSMTRPGTREDAVRQGAQGAVGTGLREYVDRAPLPPGLPVVTFDTKLRRAPGSAAKAAAKALRRRGLCHVEVGPSFWVHGTPGPLADGELARARAWGTELADRVATGRLEHAPGRG